MAEWLKAHAWKVCKEAILSWVRIPFSPPLISFILCDKFSPKSSYTKLLNEHFFIKNDIIYFSKK